jgi:hypothetical protein
LKVISTFKAPLDTLLILQIITAIVLFKGMDGGKYVSESRQERQGID